MWAATTVLYGTNVGKTNAVFAVLAEKGVEGKLATALLQAQKAIVDVRKADFANGVSAASLTPVPTKAICRILTVSGLPFRWGWSLDQPLLLLLDLPCGQVVFYASKRHAGPDYHGGIDQRQWSEGNVIAYADSLLSEDGLPAEQPSR
ncbi:hypothetical protein FF011L_11160 [Roseimaritima multifibrata]|uniref:Uncharacterized protein n=1 Tax=Roseimaritima multifibrata TaxID=1930274 RepID=A0A517MBW7_9BACT|nr:hypothetical protein [Roseimaritima multifibrata]QDS92373.1 hypothetical protein FF011L_11160 [Roseimaritima multifibrata]